MRRRNLRSTKIRPAAFLRWVEYQQLHIIPQVTTRRCGALYFPIYTTGTLPYVQAGAATRLERLPTYLLVDRSAPADTTTHQRPPHKKLRLRRIATVQRPVDSMPCTAAPAAAAPAAAATDEIQKHPGAGQNKSCTLVSIYSLPMCCYLHNRCCIPSPPSPLGASKLYLVFVHRFPPVHFGTAVVGAAAALAP